MAIFGYPVFTIIGIFMRGMCMERLSVASAFYDVSGKPWYNDRNAIRLLNQMNDEIGIERGRDRG